MSNGKHPHAPSFWLRLKALLIDYLVILGWMGFIAFISVLMFQASGGFPDYLGTLGPVGAQIVFFFALTLPVGLYLYGGESGKGHATLGKKLCSLKVLSANGTPVSRRQIVVRTVIKLLPWEIAHTFVWQLQYGFYKDGYEAVPPIWILLGLNGAMVLALIYILMVAIRKDGRGPHDITAGTQVVRLSSFSTSVKKLT